MNDQLLAINDCDLSALPNTSAMDTLRAAMMDDGQGYIKLLVARYSNDGAATPMSSFEDSPNTSQGEVILPYEDVDLARKVKDSDIPGASTDVIHQRTSSAGESSATSNSVPAVNFGDKGGKDLPSPIPTVRSKRVATLRDKFNDLGSAIRNESYTRATHDSLNESGGALQNLIPSSPRKPLEANTLNSPRLPSDTGNSGERDIYTHPNVSLLSSFNPGLV